MSITCRQYEMTTSRLEAILLMNDKRVPIQVKLEDQGREIDYKSLTNQLEPQSEFNYEEEDDIFAFIELRTDLLKPLLKVFGKYNNLYDPRITFNGAYQNSLKIELTYLGHSLIVLPELTEDVNCKVYQDHGEYQIEVEIPIKTPKGSSYPSNKKEIHRVAQVLQSTYDLLGHMGDCQHRKIA